MSKLQQVKELRYATGFGLKEAVDIVNAGRYEEVMREYEGKEPAKLLTLAEMMAPLMPGHPARRDYDALLEELNRVQDILAGITSNASHEEEG